MDTDLTSKLTGEISTQYKTSVQKNDDAKDAK
jgi:hypothetical protein